MYNIMSVSVKEEFDYLWIKFKRDIKFKNKYQCDNVKKVIKTGDKDHLYTQFFYLYNKLTTTSNNVVHNLSDNSGNIEKDREIRDLNKEITDITLSLDRSIKRNDILENTITNKNTKISSLEYEIKILKGLEKPSVLDEYEPVIRDTIPDNYDPYNQKIEYLPLNMNDYSPIDIHHVRGQVGGDIWDRMSDMEKLDKMSDPQYL